MLIPLILLVYFIFTGFLIEPFLVYVFHFKQTWRAATLAIFLSFSLAGFLSGIFVTFLTLSTGAIGAIFALHILLIIGLRRLTKIPDDMIVDYPSTEGELTAPSGAWWGAVLYEALAGYGFYLLYSSQSSGILTAPWQTIDRYYIYIFALATLLLGVLIFSRLSASTVFFLCIVHALLLHSYVPLTHDLFYGADQWRHMAVEQRVIDGRPLEPAKLSAPSDTLDAKYSLGASGLSLSTLAYSSFWGSTALVARVTQIDLVALNKWLVPILWSLLLPILLLELSHALGWGDRTSLFLVWLSALPFTWQAVGSMTLPVSFGFLTWLLFALLFIKRVQEPEWRQIPILVTCGLLSFFGYSLYLILFWLGWAVAELVLLIKIKNTPLRTSLLVIITVLAALALPVVELVTHYSAIDPAVDWFHQAKQAVGTLTAWYIAAGPQMGDTTAGNIIFNQLPAASFVSNYFVMWRWWLVSFVVLFLALVGCGFVVCLKKPHKEYQWLAIFGGAVFLSYIASRYFLIGENIFTRRLDPVLALFFLLFFVAALSAFGFFSFKKRFIWLVVLVVSCAIAASYSLGPDTRTVGSAEYAAAEYIWNREKNFADHCIIADTYPLLALEALSSKNIIGGGFPINQYFAQPELARLMQSFKNRYEESLWLDAKALTHASRCWLILPSTKQLSLPPVQQFGEVNVWRYTN